MFASIWKGAGGSTMPTPMFRQSLCTVNRLFITKQRSSRSRQLRASPPRPSRAHTCAICASDQPDCALRPTLRRFSIALTTMAQRGSSRLISRPGKKG